MLPCRQPQIPETPELSLYPAQVISPGMRWDHGSWAALSACILALLRLPAPQPCFPTSPSGEETDPLSKTKLVPQTLPWFRICIAACQEKDISSRIWRALVRFLNPFPPNTHCRTRFSTMNEPHGDRVREALPSPTACGLRIRGGSLQMQVRTSWLTGKWATPSSLAALCALQLRKWGPAQPFSSIPSSWPPRRMPK